MNPPKPLPLPGWDESVPSVRPTPGICPASELEFTADCALSLRDEKNEDMTVEGSKVQ